MFSLKKKRTDDEPETGTSTVTTDVALKMEVADPTEIVRPENPYLNLRSIRDVYLMARNGRLWEILGKYNSYVSLGETSLNIDAGGFHLEIGYGEVDQVGMETKKAYSAIAIESYSVDGMHVVGEFKNRRWGRFYACINAGQKDLIILDYGNGKRLVFNEIDDGLMKEMFDFLSGIRNTRLNTA